MAEVTRIPIGLCCWGMTYNLGVAGIGTPRRNPAPMSAFAFLEYAGRLGFNGVEIAPDLISADGEATFIAEFRRKAGELGLALTLSTPSITDPNGTSRLMTALDTADRLGAKTVRIMLSTILCGDRRPVGGLPGWQKLLDRAARSLTLLAREAGMRGLKLAIENHQDATADDLVWLCEMVSNPSLGITLDCGNPLAVGQDILPYARRVLHHVLNVHLKDYTVHAVDDGYVLARCALGDGVVPFPELLEMFSGRDIVLQLELAALVGRRIRTLVPDYWHDLGKPDVPGEDHPVMQLRARAAPKGEFRTPWERDADTELVGYEMMQVERSAAYLRTLSVGA